MLEALLKDFDIKEHPVSLEDLAEEYA